MLEAEPIETIHVYIVREEEEQPVVDSTVQDTAKVDTQPLVVKSYPIRLRLVPYLMIAAHLLIVLAAFSMHFYTILTETATITIIPKSYHLTAHLTLSNVENRVFSPVTLTQSKTVPATGKGHQPATQAHGEVTFYNTLPQEQIILAGTVLTASNGELFLTDSDVTIPAGTYAVNGQAGVSVTAQNVGPEGNIAAGAIHGLCCRAGILVLNNAFYGGQNERDFTMVTKSDITSVVSSVMPYLTEHIHTSFQQQMRRGELPTPPQCSQNISPDRNVGDEATTVTVTISESCLAGAYTSSDFQTKIQQALSQQAKHTIGAGYVLSSYAVTSPIQARIQQRTLVISAIYQGTVIFHFSSQELTSLRHQLAGKSKQQGIAMLAHLNGVDHLTVQLGKNGRFPSDPTHIHIVFLLSQ
ncbi:MAG: baseplate J/gp47 family protein [Ktedonobacteraceae bacterium]